MRIKVSLYIWQLMIIDESTLCTATCIRGVHRVHSCTCRNIDVYINKPLFNTVACLALAEFDEPKRSTLVMFGVLTIAVTIYQDRFGYGVYSGPIGTAVLVITVKWVSNATRQHIGHIRILDSRYICQKHISKIKVDYGLVLIFSDLWNSFIFHKSK